MTILESAKSLSATIDEARHELSNLSESRASERWRGPGTWSRKEILGHLIDSAANNHQRFVRAIIDGKWSGPGYDQAQWVAVGAYQTQSWSALVTIWYSFNTLIACLLEHATSAKTDAPIEVGSNSRVTLAFLATDYVTHMKHHLGQILG
jgi:hypothetical protein